MMELIFGFFIVAGILIAGFALSIVILLSTGSIGTEECWEVKNTSTGQVTEKCVRHWP